MKRDERKVFFLKNIQIRQMSLLKRFRNKILFGRSFPIFFLRKFRILPCFHFLYDSNWMFRAAGINTYFFRTHSIASSQLSAWSSLHVLRYRQSRICWTCAVVPKCATFYRDSGAGTPPRLWHGWCSHNRDGNWKEDVVKGLVGRQ